MSLSLGGLPDYDLTAKGVDFASYLPKIPSFNGSIADILGKLASMARAGAKIQAAHLGMGSSRPGGMVFLNVYQLSGKELPPFAITGF